jgi:hypothetical protein
LDLRPRDKIMQIENDYDKDVYNGDIGYIDDVDPDAGELTASFDGRTVTYGLATEWMECEKCKGEFLHLAHVAREGKASKSASFRARFRIEMLTH